MDEADESARRLREARERAGLSQREAALQLGIHYGSLNRYEKGRMRVPADLLMRAEALAGGSGSANRERATESTLAVPRVSAGLPREVRVWIQRELLDYAEAGVSEDELQIAREYYESPQFSRMFLGGAPTARTPEQVLRNVRGAARLVRDALRERGYNVAQDTSH